LELRDYYPYIRGLVAQSTSNSSSIDYTWVKRKGGKSKSNLFHLFDQAVNGLVSTSRAPARLGLVSGFFVSILGVLGGFVNLVLNLFSVNPTSSGIPTLIVGLFFFGGVQLFFTGLLGEYILSIHSQIRPLPNAFDIETVNFDKT